MSSEVLGRDLANLASTPPRALSARSLQHLEQQHVSHMARPSSGSLSGVGLGGIGSTLPKHPLMSIAMERKICLSVLRQRWSVGDKGGALEGLESLINTMDVPAVGMGSSPGGGGGGGTTGMRDPHGGSGGGGGGAAAGGSLGGMRRGSSGSFFPDGGFSGATPREGDSWIHLECLLKLGQWKLAVIEPGQLVTRSQRQEVLELYQRAINVNNKSYRAWHEWALR